MRVWLVACVIAVLVAGVAAAVVVLSGGEREEPVEGEAGAAVVEAEAAEPAATPAPEAAPAEVEAGSAVAEAEQSVGETPTFRYDRQDTTGVVAGPGSYAFLETVGDAASAIRTFEYGYSGVVELRIHPTDASGISRAAFYDTVQVGDSFDYRTKGLDCGFRFKVTGVAAAATPRTFGIEYARSFGGWCDNAVDDASDAKRVQFVWRVPAGVPGPDGVREMLPGEAVGPGTYRVFSGARWVFDVPPGMTVFHYGPALNSSGGVGVMLIDVATDSRLGIDVETGRETRRIIKSPEVSALFDQIMASIPARGWRRGRRGAGASRGATRARHPPLRPPRHHRRGYRPRQLRLPEDRRGRDECDRELRQSLRRNCRVAHPPSGRDRVIPRGVL